jgi:NADH-quinone oxidoreductase subunit K
VAVGLAHYLAVGLALFCLGLFCVLTRRNAIGVLMGVELILNAANVNFIAFSRFGVAGYDGQVFSIFVIMLAAAEAAIALAIVLGIYRRQRSIDVESMRVLQG